MKISKVDCHLLRVPFNFPLVDEPKHAFCHLVEVATDDGLTGHAITAPVMKFGVREFIRREASPAILGLDPLRTEEVRRVLARDTAPKHQLGAWNSAASLIDIALWDIKGKLFDQPIWKLIGGANSELPAYITFGVAWYTEDQLVEAANRLVAQGHNSLKMVVAAGAPKAHGQPLSAATDSGIPVDARRVRLVREAIGPDVELMIDGNSLATYPQALRLAKLCEPYDLTWYEDPIINTDPIAYARLRTQTTIPIAGGSIGTTGLAAVNNLLQSESVDYLQPNVRDIGGFTQGIKAAGIASAYNVPLAMGGNYPHINLHLHGGMPNGGRIEFHWQGWKCTEALFEGAVEPANGTVAMPEGPGLGLRLRDGAYDLAVDSVSI